jgi:hypothetical protein
MVCDKASRFCQRPSGGRRGNRRPGSALEARAKRVRVHEVRERALAVDLDDGQELAVAGLQSVVALDVDDLEGEPEVDTDGLDDLEGPSAETAVRSAIDRDSNYGYKPRVVVASATRCTASP